MKNEFLYTIQPLDYERLTALANMPGVDEAIKQAQLKMIADHKFIIDYREKLVREQKLQADGIFSFSQGGAPLDVPPSTLGLPTATENNGEKSDGSEEDDTLESANLDDHSDTDEDEELKDPAKKGGLSALPPGIVVHHRLKESDKECTGCGKRMHISRTKTKTLVIAQPLFSTKTHKVESCRCLSCQTTREAEAPREFEETVGRYHFSAVSALVALRYLYGMASCRIETFSAEVGLRVSDSTQWSLFEDTASKVLRFVAFLEKKAADAPTTHVDDTHFTIIELLKSIAIEQENAQREGKNPKTVRSGVHTTNLTGVYKEGSIVLFRSGLHHAGEALAKVLSARTTKEAVIIMADAASANTSKLNTIEAQTKIANCNSHSVRKAKELAQAEERVAREAGILDHKLSEPIDSFLKKYKTVFENDSKTKGWPPEKRLDFHRTNSLPVMASLLKRIESDFRTKSVEPASDLGRVYSYFKNHYNELIAFCQLEGAPICNNLSERMLKGAIRHRKNSLFVRNTLGARVADIFWSILFTAKCNGLQPIEYLTNLLKYPDHWAKNPEAWLPWNYPGTMRTLAE